MSARTTDTPFITGTQAKVLSHCTEDWQFTIDIAHWSGYSYSTALMHLKALWKLGLVEYQWDGNLGKGIWRIKQ